VIKEFETKNYYELEQALHRLLEPYRINRSREFFTDKCLPYVEQIVAIHQGIQGRSWLHAAGDYGLPPLSLMSWREVGHPGQVDLTVCASRHFRVYVDTNASYFVKLFGKLSWNVSSYVNVDTRPPVHFSGSDYGTSSGLSLNFGNK
jgi:hypothetical protein